MIRTATLLPVKPTEVQWIRYTGDNFAEIEDFIAKTKRFGKTEYEFYLATDESKTIYWAEHGKIKIGDFIVIGAANHSNTKWDGYAIIAWKDFPRIINEDIPVYMDEYLQWLEKQPK